MRFKADDVIDQAQDLYSASRKMAWRWTKQANTFIHKEPVLPVLLGLGAGFLISKIFHRD